LRLFACGCCRQVWRLLTDGRSRGAVEVAERYADGGAGERERGKARASALGAAGRGARQAAWAVYWAASRNTAESVWNACAAAAQAATWTAAADAGLAGHDRAAAWDGARVSAGQAQAALLRELFGNPFHDTPLDPRWLTPTVAALGRQAYDDCDFALLPILADALEDAGCDSGELLAHLRGGGEHVRGCWALDRVLGQE
jgi:hypothetical protein